MADSKITALTAISTVDPTADPLVIVDVSDTSMAASGTTKKSTINQLLGAGGTATLASATISGDLTVDTNTLKVDSANNRVGIVKTTPAYPLDVGGRISYSGAIGEGADTTVSSIGTSLLFGNAANWSECQFFAGGNLQHRMQSAGVFTWLDGAGGTRMTLNSTGLGVGVTPGTKFDVGLSGAGTPRIRFTSASDNPILEFQRYSGVASDYYGERILTGGGFYFQTAPAAAVGSQTFTTRMSLDASGRLILLASTTTPATLSTNGQLTMTATSDTNLRFSYRGSDGVTRVANLTLA